MAIIPLTNDNVRTGTNFSHVMPSIAAHPAGGYVMAWASFESIDGRSTWNIYVARFADPDFTQAGVRVNSDISAAQRLHPNVTVLPSGMYVVTWTDQSWAGPDPDPSSWGVRGRLFAADGSPVGPDFLVNTTTAEMQWQPEGVALAGGGFVIEWQNSNSLTHTVDSRAQIFDSSGNKVGGEIVVGDATTSITALPSGGFLSAYAVYVAGSGETIQFRIAAQRFDAAGNKVGAEFTVLGATQTNVFEVETVTLSTGGFVVAWVANGGSGDGSGKAVKAQVFDAAGSPVGGPIAVNSFTAGDQFQLDLSALPGGGFVATWSDTAGSGGDGSSYSIKGQVFDSTGAKVDPEFLVNLKTSSIQQNPAITTLGDGHITIAWQDDDSSGGYDLRSRTFSVPLTGTDGADSFTGTKDTDQFIGKGGDDTFVFPVRPRGPLDREAPHESTWGGGDTVDGGAGFDRLVVSGDVIFALGPQSLVNVEAIQFLPAGPGKMFPPRNFTMHDANVAAGATLRVDASLLPYGEQLMFYGQNELDGRFVVFGGASNDFIFGGQQGDEITGGLLNDYLRGNGGNDIFFFNGINEIRGDDIGGGPGLDQLVLKGDMSAGAMVGVTMAEIELITLTSAGPGGYYSYNLTITDPMVAAGRLLTVDGTALRPGESLMFYGSAETSGGLVVRGGASSDYIFGGQGDDTIRGGLARDILRGEGGNDSFEAGSVDELRGDDIVGGAGSDRLLLFGQMDAGALVGLTMTGVETIRLGSVGPGGAGFGYNLTTTDSMVAAGQTMTIDASNLVFNDRLMFYGDAESDGNFAVLGGAGNDYIFGSQNGDTIRGGLLSDYIRGNGGADILVYLTAGESTNRTFDVIVGFDRSADRFDLPVTVTGFGGEVNQGRLSNSTFSSDMAAAMNGVLGSGQAALFNPNSGDYAGRSFLVVDGNNTAGYQAGSDYVFEMVNPTAPMTGPADYFI